MERNENGYSGLGSRGTRATEENRNYSCPGTGGLWRGENGMQGGNENNTLMGEMSPEELMIAHNACSKHQLAMVYSPNQCFRKMYSPDEALKHGTLFEELYKPLEDCRNG